MKEIVMPEAYYSEKFGITIAPYVKADDVISIAQTALTMDDPMEQEISIAVNVIRECTDINVDGYLDNLDVDKIMHSGLWEEVQDHIDNIIDIRRYIAKKEDAGIAVARFFNITMTDFIEELNDKLDAYLDVDGLERLVNDAPKSLNEILDIVKKDGNADIIRGALQLGSVNQDQKADDEE